MTDDKLTQLLNRFDEVTAKATPGPWNHWFGYVPAQEMPNGDICSLLHPSGPPQRHDDKECFVKADRDSDAIVTWRACAEALSAVARASGAYVADTQRSRAELYDDLLKSLANLAAVEL